MSSTVPRERPATHFTRGHAGRSGRAGNFQAPVTGKIKSISQAPFKGAPGAEREFPQVCASFRKPHLARIEGKKSCVFKHI
jgi:hypothetical protein